MNPLPSLQATSFKSTNEKLFTAFALMFMLTAPFLPFLTNAQRSNSEADAATGAAPSQTDIEHQPAGSGTAPATTRAGGVLLQL